MKEEKTYDYSVTIPLMPGNEKDWPLYLDGCKRIRANRVFLFTPLDNICRSPVPVKKQYGSEEILKAYPHQESCDIPSLELYQIWADEYKKRTALFLENGMEAAFWIGETIGHGGGIAAGKSPFQQLTGPLGQETPGCNCPLDEDFITYMEQVFTIIAKTGTPLILLDDDFRLNYHLPGVTVGCFCPLHIREFNRKNHTRYTREELVSLAFSREHNAVRTLWYDHISDSMIRLAQRIEKAVHIVNPDTRIGLATAMTHWSNEGFEVKEILKALAGNTRPFLRTYGSPYRSENKISHIGRITEFTAMQYAKVSDEDIEVLAEGDTYPHTRYFCPAQMLHSYEQSLHALGFPGILTYPVPFSATVSHETGYLSVTEKHQENYRAIRNLFHAGLSSTGVYPFWKPDNMRWMTLPEEVDFHKLTWPDEPVGVYFLAKMGIPVAGEKGYSPMIATGYGLAGLDDAGIEALLDDGVILDSVSASLLLKRGFDIGIESICVKSGPRFEYFSDKDFSGGQQGEMIWLLTGGTDTYSLIAPKPGSRTISEFYDGADTRPAVVLYENAKNQRFMIYAFDFALADKGMQLLSNYARQEQLARCCAWLNRQPLTVTANGYPDLHVICRESADGNEIAIGIQNTHLDPIEDVVLRLNPRIRVGKQIQVLYPDAGQPVETDQFIYTNDGNYGYLTVKGTIAPMSLLSVVLKQ